MMTDDFQNGESKLGIVNECERDCLSVSVSSAIVQAEPLLVLLAAVVNE